MSSIIHTVPGGTVGINPKTAGRPWGLLGFSQYQVTVGTANEFFLSTNGGGVTENQVDVANQLAGWHFTTTAVAAGQRHGIGYGDQTGQGLTFFPRFPALSSIMSGAIVGAQAAKYGHWYLEVDVKHTATVGDANECMALICPSYSPVGGAIGLAGGFGLAWANTLANDNWRLFIAPEAAALLADVDTGIPAISANWYLIRIEWGWINGAPRIIAFIDGVQRAEIVGPLTLNTVGRLAAFTKGTYIGVDKSTATALTFNEMWAGMGRGVEIGRVDI